MICRYHENFYGDHMFIIYVKMLFIIILIYFNNLHIIIIKLYLFFYSK
jgi:hypothetical protein